MELKHIPRGENQEADELARRAARREAQKPGVFEERLTKASVKQPVVNMSIDEELPPAPSSGAPNCGLPSGYRLLMTLVRQDTGWIDGGLGESLLEHSRLLGFSSCCSPGEVICFLVFPRDSGC